eukprot:COSAG03_NODE_22857_length_286_cov_0.770053_1_plen_42_part_10
MTVDTQGMYTSLARVWAYYGRVPGILWGEGHTMVCSGAGILW